MNFQQKNYQQDLDMAKRVQEGLLSVEWPTIPGICIAKRCIAADSVGGDFYTFVSKKSHSLQAKSKIPGVVQYIDTREDQLGIIIGDVAGHGVSSALVMALSSGLLTEISRHSKSPSEALFKANNTILKYIENSHVRYITVLYLSVILGSRKIIWSKAGHPDALLLKHDGSLQTLIGEGCVLGMFEDEQFSEQTCVLNAHDRLILYTDGMTEARNRQGTEFGIEGLTQVLINQSHLSTEDLLDFVFNEVALFSEGLDPKDDQTMVIIELE